MSSPSTDNTKNFLPGLCGVERVLSASDSVALHPSVFNDRIMARLARLTLKNHGSINRMATRNKITRKQLFREKRYTASISTTSRATADDQDEFPDPTSPFRSARVDSSDLKNLK